MAEIIKSRRFWDIFFEDLLEIQPNIFANKNLKISISDSYVQIEHNGKNLKFDEQSLPGYIGCVYPRIKKLRKLGPLKVAIAGGSGQIGQFLSKCFGSLGWKVAIISRSRRKGVYSDYSEVLETNLGDYHMVINLCGISILKLAFMPWKINEILNSRVNPTRFLASRTPHSAILLNASAIGFYKGEGEVDEKSNHLNSSRIPSIVKAWEEASKIHQNSVQLRFGNVISKNNEIFKLIRLANILPFKIFVKSKSYVNWLGLEKILEIIELVLSQNIRGPINVVSGNCDWVSFQKALQPSSKPTIWLKDSLLKFLNPVFAELIFTNFKVKSIYYSPDQNIKDYLDLLNYEVWLSKL